MGRGVEVFWVDVTGSVGLISASPLFTSTWLRARNDVFWRPKGCRTTKGRCRAEQLEQAILEFQDSKCQERIFQTTSRRSGRGLKDSILKFWALNPAIQEFFPGKKLWPLWSSCDGSKIPFGVYIVHLTSWALSPGIQELCSEILTLESHCNALRRGSVTKCFKCEVRRKFCAHVHTYYKYLIYFNIRYIRGTPSDQQSPCFKKQNKHIEVRIVCSKTIDCA